MHSFIIIEHFAKGGRLYRHKESLGTHGVVVGIVYSNAAWEWDQSVCRLALYFFIFFPRQTQPLCLLWFGLTISRTLKWVGSSSISGRNRYDRIENTQLDTAKARKKEEEKNGGRQRYFVCPNLEIGIFIRPHMPCIVRVIHTQSLKQMIMA